MKLKTYNTILYIKERCTYLYLRILNTKFSQKDRVTIKIEPYNNIDLKTKVEVDKMFKKVFNRTLTEHEIDWAKPHWIATGSIKNKIVSLRYFLKTSVLFDDEKVSIGGTGGLLTLPAYRGLGIAPEVFKYVDNYIMTELNVDCSLFICSENLVQYYSKMGWYKVNCKLYFNPNGVCERLFGLCVMLKSCNNKYSPSVIKVEGKLW